MEFVTGYLGIDIDSWKTIIRGLYINRGAYDDQDDDDDDEQLE